MQSAYESHKRMEARLQPVPGHNRSMDARAIDLTTRSPEVQITNTVQSAVPRAVAVPRVQLLPQEKQPDQLPGGKQGSLFNTWKQQQEPSGMNRTF